MRHLLTILFLSLLLYACEKDITLDLQQRETNIVVDAYIEQGKPPIVILSHDLSLYDQVDSNAIRSYGIRADQVEISDGVSSFPLTEISYRGFTAYTSLLFSGQLGKTYTLTIRSEGKVLSAITHIPQPVKLDSISFVPKNDTSIFGRLALHFKDPDTLGNCYRIFTRRLKRDKDFSTGNFSVLEDRLFNGQSFDLNIRRGSGRTEEEDTTDQLGERGYFRKGDSVIVKWCSIDRHTYDFWRTAAMSNNTNGNPFASPVTIRSNVNGGLGVWAGYGAFYDTVLVK